MTTNLRPNVVFLSPCSGGVGRTGVFCAISIMIERLKAEGVVDVFQTVQAMRLQRPAMVQTAVRVTSHHLSSLITASVSSPRY